MPRLKLTAPAIARLETLPEREIFWDTALPGFGVRVTQGGSKSFVVQYRPGGGGRSAPLYPSFPRGCIRLAELPSSHRQEVVGKWLGRDARSKNLVRKG